MKETETPLATPEQLLKLLDLQLATQRQHREKSQRNRALILVGGMLFIVVATAAALFVLGQMLEDYRTNGAPAQRMADESEQR